MDVWCCVVMQSFFGFGTTPDIKIEFKDADHRKKVAVKNENGNYINAMHCMHTPLQSNERVTHLCVVAMVVVVVVVVCVWCGAGELEELYLFTANDDVSGTIFIDLPKGKKLEHTGIKVELIGLIGSCVQRLRIALSTAIHSHRLSFCLRGASPVADARMVVLWWMAMWCGERNGRCITCWRLFRVFVRPRKSVRIFDPFA